MTETSNHTPTTPAWMIDSLRANSQRAAELPSQPRLQLVPSDPNAPNWTKPDPYRPQSLDSVCQEGYYRHEDGNFEDALEAELGSNHAFF